jgi:hypothetical protein
MFRITCVILLSVPVAGCSESPPSQPSPWITSGPAPRPIVTGVSPARGSTGGGTPLKIIGTGFQAGATITLGGTRHFVSVHGTKHLSLTTLAHHAGIVDMIVTGPQGQVETFEAAFEYAAPEAFDFNGRWEDDHEPGFEVFIDGNAVMGFTCGGINTTLLSPLPVRLGAFSLTNDGGVEVLSGRIVTDGLAIGTIDTPGCGFGPWRAVRK